MLFSLYIHCLYIGKKTCLNKGPQSKSKQKKILEADNYDLSLAEVHITSGS